MRSFVESYHQNQAIRHDHSTLSDAAGLFLALAACGVAEGDSGTNTPADVAFEEATAAATITIQPVGNQMEYANTAFTAPSEPGEYTYFCTFPGHYMTMRGTMTVAPA